MTAEEPEIRNDIASARRGDQEALQRILVAVQSRLRTAASHRLAGPLRAKMGTSDLVQSSYLTIVERISEFRGEDTATFVAWVTRIMENNLRDRLRYYGRQRRAPEGSQDETFDAVADMPTPSAGVMRAEEHAVFHKALASLPDEQRQIIQLRLIEGREYDEIAGMLGRSPGALRMLLSRARAALTLRVDRLLDDRA
ncbi:MAG: sigma-70 family RNA polymerase sigma factor [Planctomycetota bacterium]